MTHQTKKHTPARGVFNRDYKPSFKVYDPPSSKCCCWKVVLLSVLLSLVADGLYTIVLAWSLV